MYSQLTVAKLFDLSQTQAETLLNRFQYPWEALPHIKEFILALGPSLPKDEYEEIKENVWAAKSAVIFPTAYLNGPVIIGKNTEVRHGAFIRGSALVGDSAVVGNSTELKNVILFNNVQVPHYNYVGDSILGYRSHMGAGSITSNVKSDKTLVTVKYQGEKITTGLKKFGAILGDCVEVGCNSVLNPGSVICPNSNIYPLSMVRGVVPPKASIKQLRKSLKNFRSNKNDRY